MSVADGQIKGRVLICVPTWLRPKMLRNTLCALAQTKIPHGYEVSFLLLDNDIKESALEVFAEFEFPFPARYAVEAQRGLSSVQNRAMEEAKIENASHLAFSPDNCRNDENWLRALIEGAEKTGADIVSGRVEFVFPNGEAPWWIDPPKIPKDADAEISPGFVGSPMLFKARVFADLRFDEKFNLTGGEEYDFFLRAMRRDFVFARTGKAKVQKFFPASRLDFWRHTKIQWHRQMGYVASHRSVDGGASTLRFLPKGILKMAKGALCCAIAPIAGKKMLRRGVKNIVAGSGLFCGVFGRGNRHQYYKVVDGG